VSDHYQFASAEIEQLLIANGLRDLNSAFELGEPVDGEHKSLAGRHEHKTVVTLQLKSPSGDVRVYIKRQWRRERLLPRPTDLRHRINVKCSPVHEWHGLRLMQRSGFDVSEPLAIFWHGWGFSRGAVVTRAVPPSRSLRDMICSGEFEAMDRGRRESLARAAADVVVRLHERRMSWRSMKVKHFYPEEVAPNSWRMWLIDCEGVYRWASRRDRRREWTTFLNFITQRAPALREAFCGAYEQAARKAA
jgi:hypothetical protein